MKSRVLYEDNNIIVVHKPAGIATQTARVGQRDMVSEVTRYLACGRREAESRQKEPEIPYVGLVHRLDQPVEGILVFARDKRSAAELSKQIADGRMEKYYYGAVCGQTFPDRGELVDYLVRDGKSNTSRIVPKEIKGAKIARLDYQMVNRKSIGLPNGETAQIALARIHLRTGRHHQIRVQMSHSGLSLLGDYKYGDALTAGISEQMQIREIALCACQLGFEHPRTGEKMQFQITPEGRIFRLLME